MTKSPQVLAIIPARGGSKRIPQKNLAEVGGLRLVDRAMDEAIKSQVFSQIILSSDDPEILARAQIYPGVQGLERNEHLANDTARSVDVVAEILRGLGPRFDYVCLLQPTSPFRKASHIREAFAQMQSEQLKTLVSVKPVQSNPFHLVVKQGREVKPFLESAIFQFQTQMTPDLFCLNGCIYFAKSNYFAQNKSFLSDEAGLYLMSEEDSLDIDTPEELALARRRFEHLDTK